LGSEDKVLMGLWHIDTAPPRLLLCRFD
jgi:hypothetical protein